ncbi:uncharacterized protein [Nicotiana sylvestris]|uniref:uncharacterized protein n=1 Tax=Nicotiana sylvestris TaxID=4096 RepID=UPI00388C86F6
MQLGRYQVVPEDEDLTTQVIELHPEATLPETLVYRYLKNGTQVPDVAKGEVDPNYAACFEERSYVNNEPEPEPEPEPERPAKRPHVQAFDEKIPERLAWGEKEKKYQVAIHTLEEKLRNMEFNNDLQAQEAECERRRLAQENETLRAQVRKIRIAVRDYEDDLQKTEAELANARAKLAKNAEGRASFVRQLKEKYDKGMVSIKKKFNVLENEMSKQARDFKAEREHCYALMAQLEKDLQQLQEQNHTAEQVLDTRSQQIGRLLQEKGIIREWVRRIADHIVMKCNECEDMTRSMFFASVMIFVRQIMDDLFRLQEDMAQRHTTRPTRAAVEALMQVVSLFGILETHPYNTRSKDKLIMAGQELDASIIDLSREGEESDVNLKEELHKLKHQMVEMYQAWMKGHPPPSYPANLAFVLPLAQSQEPPTVDSSPAFPITITTKLVTQLLVINTKAIPWNYERVIVTYKGKEVKEEVNEAQGLTHSGRCFAPEELRKAKTYRDNPVLKKAVTEEETEEFLRKIKVQDYSNVEQLRKTPAQISLLLLLIHSDEHRQALMKILKEAHVPDKISVNHMENISNKIFEVNRVTFFDDELPVEGTEHNKALYLTIKYEDSVVIRVLVDNGSSENIYPLSTLNKLKVDDERIHKNNICIRGFDGGGKDSVGDIVIELTIGPVEFTMEFQVLDVAISYNLLLG